MVLMDWAQMEAQVQLEEAKAVEAKAARRQARVSLCADRSGDRRLPRLRRLRLPPSQISPG